MAGFYPPNEEDTTLECRIDFLEGYINELRKEVDKLQDLSWKTKTRPSKVFCGHWWAFWKIHDWSSWADYERGEYSNTRNYIIQYRECNCCMKKQLRLQNEPTPFLFNA